MKTPEEIYKMAPSEALVYFKSLTNLQLIELGKALDEKWINKTKEEWFNAGKPDTSGLPK